MFPARPFERALIAWDVASRTLLGLDDSSLYSWIVTEVGPLKAFGGPRSAAVPRDHVPNLIEAVRDQHDENELPCLAALVRAPVADGHAEAVLAHARKFSLAHLPSLALAFAQILWERFAVPEALDVMIEIGLDYGMIEAVPVMTGQDDRSMVQQLYLLVRDRLADYAAGAAREILEGLLKHPGVAHSTDPRLALVMAEVAFQSGISPPPPLVAAVSAAAPIGTRWRYAAYVRDAAAMHADPETPIMCLDDFITTFGNYAPMWAQASSHDAQRADLLALLSRELR